MLVVLLLVLGQKPCTKEPYSASAKICARAYFGDKVLQLVAISCSVTLKVCVVMYNASPSIRGEWFSFQHTGMKISFP